MRRRFVFAAISVLALSAALVIKAEARGTVLFDQSTNLTEFGTVSQEFPDFPDFTTAEFDDFTVPSPGWFISRITIYGVEQGNSNLTTNLRLIITRAPGLNQTRVVDITTAGTGHGPNLVFNLNNIQLNPGTYWIAAWVVRQFGNGGGQWFWLRRNPPVNGSEHYFHNPGGGFGFGSDPIPGTQVFGSPADLGFKIEGKVVPEPASMIALSAGIVGLLGLRRRKK